MSAKPRTTVVWVQEGDAWNERFRDKDNLKNKGLMVKFFAEIKSRLVSRYGRINSAFLKFCTGGQECLLFAEFDYMLKSVQINLEQRFCRSVFDVASSGERTLDFEKLRSLLIEETRTKMQATMMEASGRHSRVNSHKAAFIRRLILGYPKIAIKASERLQAKITVEFCRTFWGFMKASSQQAPTPYINLNRHIFRLAVQNAQRDGLQPQDAVFLMRIHRRLEVFQPSVYICDVLVAFLIISSDQDLYKKLRLVYEVFDDDFDGCVMWDQLLEVFCCLCRVRPRTELSSMPSRDPGFQLDLSAQEGVRAYESVRWAIQRASRSCEQDLVSFSEFWSGMQQQPELLCTLMPPSIHMDAWILEPTPFEAEDIAFMDGVDREPAPNGRTRRSSKLLSVVDVQPLAPLRPPPSAPHGRPGDGEASHFRAARKQLFQQSLRRTGFARLDQLTAGFAPIPDAKDLDRMVPEDLDCSSPKGRMTSPAGTRRGMMNTSMSSFNTSTSSDAGSWCQGFQLQMPGTPGAPSATPSPGTPIMGGKAPSSKGPLARSVGRPMTGGSRSSGGVRSTPLLPVAPQRQSPGPLASALKGPQANATERLWEGVPSMPPRLHSEYLGPEAVDRFRLVANLRGASVGGKRGTSRSASSLDSANGQAFKCQLCERQHSIHTECSNNR